MKQFGKSVVRAGGPPRPLKFTKFVSRLGLAAASGGSLCLVACGGAPSNELASDEEIGSLEQEWGESSCRDALPDFAMSTVAREAFTSPTATYDHPNCRNTYIGSKRVKNPLREILGPNELVNRAEAKYAGPIVPPSWGCAGMWVKLSIMLGTNVNPELGPFEASTVFGQEVNGTCLPPQTSVEFFNLSVIFTFPDLFSSSGYFPRILAQAGYGNTFQKVGIEWAYDTFLPISGGDANFGDQEWASGLYKARCGPTQVIAGVSREPSAPNRVGTVLCRQDQRIDGDLSNDQLLDFWGGDDRRDTTTGDWAENYIKGECARGWAMTGLAQTKDGIVEKAQCSSLGSVSATDVCSTQLFDGGDSRSSLKFADWSPGSFKGQCADDSVVKGISIDHAGHPRSLLCCAKSLPR